MNKEIIERKLSELVDNIKSTKAKFNNKCILNALDDNITINEECVLLSTYAYELEKMILIKVIFEIGHKQIALDFDKSASFPKHKNSIIEENINIFQSNCKLYGKNIDDLFEEVRKNFKGYLEFLAEDAAGPKRFVNLANS